MAVSPIICILGEALEKLFILNYLLNYLKYNYLLNIMSSKKKLLKFKLTKSYKTKHTNKSTLAIYIFFNEAFINCYA